MNEKKKSFFNMMIKKKLESILYLLCLVLLSTGGVAVVLAEPDFDECTRSIRQFFECKHLQMKPVDSFTYRLLSIRYQPDSSIPGNVLNETFYERTLANMSLPDALDLQWSIYYNSTHPNCSSEFCACVSMRDWLRSSSYERLFRDFETFVQAKQAIIDIYTLDNALSNNTRVTIASDNFSSALNSFCVKYDMLFEGRVFGKYKSQQIISWYDFTEQMVRLTFS